MASFASFHSVLRASAPLAAAAALLFSASAAFAADVTVSDAWARASAGPAKTGAAFFTVTNSGSSDDQLLSASSPAVSATDELHTHIKDGDVMRMRQVEKIDVPAGKAVTLQPGGLHVMLMSLSAPLAEGQTFPLTLTFAKAGTIETTVTVKAPGAMGQMDHSQMDHSKMDHGAMDHSGHTKQ